jgi:RNA polymerase sigma-70 factor (ECF subfamily)
MLAEAMAKLAPKYRVVLHLYYYEGLTAEEIGKVQGLPAGTVRMQLSRARAMLKELLQQSDSELFAEGGGKHD